MSIQLKIIHFTIVVHKENRIPSSLPFRHFRRLWVELRFFAGCFCNQQTVSAVLYAGWFCSFNAPPADTATFRHKSASFFLVFFQFFACQALLFPGLPLSFRPSRLRFRSVFSMEPQPQTGSVGPRGALVYENMHSPIQSTVYRPFVVVCFHQSHPPGHQNAPIPDRFCPEKGLWDLSPAGVPSVILHNCPPVADHFQQTRPSFGR
mgnify:CR=1 FL=1